MKKWLCWLLLTPVAAADREVVVNLDRRCDLRYRTQSLGQSPGPWVELPAGQGSHRVHLPDREVVLQARSDAGFLRYQGEKPVSPMASLVDLPLSASPHPWRCGLLLTAGLSLYVWQRHRERRRLQNWVTRLDDLLSGAQALSLCTGQAEILARSAQTAEALLDTEGVLVVGDGPALVYRRGLEVALERLAQSTLLNRDLVAFDPAELGLGGVWRAGLGFCLKGGLYWLGFSRRSRSFGPEAGLFRAQLEAALENLRLTEANTQNAKMAALGQMAAGLAHELNNPLGAAQLALDTAQLLDTGALAQPLGKIGRAIARARTTTDNFLYYIRGEVETVREPVNLAAALKECLEELEYALEDLRLELDVPEFLQCQGHPHELQKAFSNLILNARDAAREGPPPPWLKVTGRAQGERVWLEFRDSGTGVPSELQQKIFDPFFTTKAVGEGSGLGLVIARSVAVHHQGSLTYENGCFRLELSCG